MSKGIKQRVRMVSYVDGKVTRDVVETRTVYQKANGDYQINWMGAKADLIVQQDGQLRHDFYIRSIRCTTIDKVLRALPARPITIVGMFD